MKGRYKIPKKTMHNPNHNTYISEFHCCLNKLKNKEFKTYLKEKKSINICKATSEVTI